MGNELLPEEKVLNAAGITPALVQQYSTEIEFLPNGRQALIRFSGIKLIMDSQLDQVREAWEEYQASRPDDHVS